MAIDYQRYCKRIYPDRLVLEPFRTNRRNAVRETVGASYSDDGSSKPIPINLLALYRQVIGPNLIAKEPRVMVSTFKHQHKAIVNAMEGWANLEIERMDLANTLERCVDDALYSIGICKVALSTPSDAAVQAWNLQAGNAFACRIDLDDWVYDTHARDFNEAAYMGHRYRVPIDTIKDSKLYSKERKKLSPTYDNPYNMQGDERINRIGMGYKGDQDDAEDMIDLWEIYVPRHRLVLTFADEQMTNPYQEPLRVQNWIGPDSGPYVFFRYGIVPGNAMPLAPIMNLRELHNGVNRWYRKLMRQTDRAKDWTAISGGADADGNRVQKVNDGEVLKVDNPQNITPVSMGGANQKIWAMVEVGIKMFKELAGGLDLLGGIAPQSKTATQDKMLNENAGRGVADMQARTVKSTAQVLKSLMWFWHHDPKTHQVSYYQVPGVPEIPTIPREPVTPEDRLKIPFDELDIRVDPYSMQHSTPQSRMAMLNQVMTQVVMPMSGLLQQQGIGVDMGKFLEKIAKYGDMTDLNEIITIQEPMQDTPKGGEEPGMPANTTRTYERVSSPGSTDRGDSQNRVNQLMNVDAGGSPNGQTNGAFGG